MSVKTVKFYPELFLYLLFIDQLSLILVCCNNQETIARLIYIIKKFQYFGHWGWQWENKGKL